MHYISTRGRAPHLDFSGVVLSGLAPDGGLYMPAAWPRLSGPLTSDVGYIDAARTVMAPFMPALAGPALDRMLHAAYAPRDDGFAVPHVTHTHALSDRLSVLELFHGPTLAFKDVALQFLGQLFGEIVGQSDAAQPLTILGATSGDTGSAAMEGCRHTRGVRMVILYPDGGPSDVQRRQMTTVPDAHIQAVAVAGTFDECQALVKAAFRDPAMRAQLRLTAVNSINWARILAQAVYYARAAFAAPAPVTFVVPTGNFGNIFAGYVAQAMGAPIKHLVMATNANDALVQFYNHGHMPRMAVQTTLSPSMDIQVPSNFERLLFELMDRDADRLRATMAAFESGGDLTLPPDMMAKLRSNFTAICISDAQTAATMSRIYRTYGYVCDPHTAVGLAAVQEILNSTDGPVIALGCAHPAKFPKPVFMATGVDAALPARLSDLHSRPERIKKLPADFAALAAFLAG